MKIVRNVMLGFSFAFAASSLVTAQEMQGPPKVLQVTREFLKPGKSGAMHDKSESNFVTAMTRAKWTTRYLALNSLSGKSRALYLTGYDSFDAWEKDYAAVMKNSALAAELDKDSVADGELLDGLDQIVFTYDEDKSYRANHSLAMSHYMEISSFTIKPGHAKEFDELVKLVIDTHKKAGTSAHWATYEIAYGGDNEFAVLTDDKSMADIDTGFAEDKQFRDALGDEGMKKLHALETDCIESSDYELFAFNPKQSYAPDEWVKANPDFWKPKAMAPVAKPAPAAKPAQ